MATSITTTYAGEFKDRYVSAALLSGTTLANGGVSIMPNVAYKEVIQKVASDDNFIKDASCDYTDAGTLTLTERILAVEEFQVNKTECKKNFNQTWQSAQMGYSVPNEVLPKNLADFIVQHYVAKIADSRETTIWQGANATAGQFDGFTVLFAADADVVDVVGTTVTAANVVTELGKVVDDIPDTVLYQPDLKIYVSNHIWNCYLRSLGGFGSSGLGAAGYDNKGNNQAFNSLMFDGIELFRAAGMPTNDMVAARTSNLWYGCGIQNDLSDIRLIDTADTLGDQNVRFVARWKDGIQYGLGAEVVYYT